VVEQIKKELKPELVASAQQATSIAGR